MKRLLLDTHVLLWWLADDPKLGPQTVELISDTRNEIFISAASSWEIAIKKKLGKLEAPDDIDTAVEGEGFSKLPEIFPCIIKTRLTGCWLLRPRLKGCALSLTTAGLSCMMCRSSVR